MVAPIKILARLCAGFFIVFLRELLYSNEIMEETSTIHDNLIPILTISGTHLTMGQQMGEGLRPLIQHSIENARQLIESTVDDLRLTWEGAKNQARKYLPFVQERYPQYIDELTGIAQGANVNLTEVAVVNFMEGVTVDALHLTKCTSLSVNGRNTANHHVLIAHNEDWLPEDEEDVFIVKAKPDNEPSFVAMSYGGLLPNIGFNEMGIAQCCETVYPADTRIGIPRVVVSRAVLAAKNISEAIRSTLVPLRAAGYNHLLVHESGEMYNVEVSARNFDILYAENGYLAHTNNYLSPKMQAIENNPDELIHTRVRYFRALRLLTENSRHTMQSLGDILSDHVNHPDSICNHSMNAPAFFDRQKTIVSMLIDLTDRKMEVAWGNPCINTFKPCKIEL